MASFVISEETLFRSILIFQYLACPIAALYLRSIAAPYGRHRPSGHSGPTLHPSLAWFIMESPTLWLTFIVYPFGRYSSHPLAIATISLYLIHYLHRTLIYPLRLSSSARFPLTVCLTGFTVNSLNAYLQSRSASHYTDYHNLSTSFTSVRVVLGVLVFAWGMQVNVRTDRELVRLKEEGGGYKIPRGGWFEMVACPNYMGEVAEWAGLAAVAWSPATAGFFLSTCANLVPRARSHLVWYREKFGDEYPLKRTAIVPFLY